MRNSKGQWHKNRSRKEKTIKRINNARKKIAKSEKIKEYFLEKTYHGMIKMH
jgi:hypothetical protein